MREPKPIAVSAANAVTIIARHDRALAFYDGRPIHPATPTGALIPLAELPALIGALKAQIVPATKRQVAETIAVIAGTWPNAHQRADRTVMDLHARILEQELSCFPADILAETVRGLSHELRFMPSIAEIWQPASRMLCERQQRLRLAEQHQREHERRAEEARAEAEREAEDKRQREARLARLQRLYGAAWPRCTLEEFTLTCDALHLVGVRRARPWREALDAGEPWAVALVPIGMVAGRVFGLCKAKKIAWGSEASQLVSLIGRDLDRAREQITAIETGNAPGDWHTSDDTMVWNDPHRELDDIADELRRRHAVVPA